MIMIRYLLWTVGFVYIKSKAASAKDVQERCASLILE